jgi:hypothetical protein
LDNIERAMRVMTHVNIGGALGVAAWIAWSSLQGPAGDLTPAPEQASVRGNLPQHGEAANTGTQASAGSAP